MRWRVGVAGSPIAHSLSPQLHERGMELAGFEGSSQRVPLDAARARELRAIMGRDYDALSITMPLKAPAATLCDELDACAASLGVVNSLLWRDGRLLGAATDGPGFVDALEGEFRVGPENMHVVVLGSGGAAGAIVDALVHGGVHSISVLGRNVERVGQLVGRYANVTDEMVLYRPVDLIVNATPVTGRARDAAVAQGVTRDTVAVDITYEPRTSPWLSLYADLGCRHANGLAMLAYQAARQMNWWWGGDLRGADLLEAIS
jgi:shikimate dehydrogenase